MKELLILSGEIAGPEGRVQEFQVFPLGAIQINGWKKPLILGPEDVGRIVAAFKDRGTDMVVDYEHQTEGGEWSAPDGRAPAAGWVKELKDKGEQGLFAVVEWTSRALEYLRNREYRYFSPVVDFDRETGRVWGLRRIALTNAPKTNNLQPLVAKDATPQGGDAQDGKGGNVMREKLIAILGLAEGATDEEIVAAIQAMADAAKGEGSSETVEAKERDAALGLLKDVASELEVEDGTDKDKLLSAISTLKLKGTGSEDLAGRLKALEDEKAEKDAQELVSAALKDGKLTPAQKDESLKFARRDPDGFKAFVEKAPQVVPTGDLAVLKDSPGGFSPEEVTVGKQLGLSPDQMKAAKQKTENKDPWGG